MVSVNHSPASAASDIQSRHWLVRWLPPRLQAFALIARWDRPVGVWLMLLPGLWGLVLGAGGLPAWHYLLLFLIGGWAMRGAGCTINDIMDRRLDARVARTAGRPLAAGAVSPRAAWIWLALQLSVGLSVLLQLPLLAQIAGWAALPLILLYPLMKRITWWPQAWLGLTFNWGIWIGIATTRLPLPGDFLFYLGAILWTIGYDTIYAVQDRDDDASIGVRSTARLFGHWTRAIVFGFYGGALGLWLVAGLLGGLSPLYVLGWIVTALVCLWLLRGWREDEALSCRRAFIRNQWVGLALLLAIVAGSL